MLRLVAVATAAILGVGGAAWARQAVHFVDGRTLEVASVATQGEFAVLNFEGGGVLAVPLSRLAGVAQLPDPEPVPEATLDLAAAPPALAETDDLEPWRLAAGPYADLIADAARRHDLDPALLTSLARVESALDARAVSPKGACGLLQLMPQTASRFGVRDVFDATENVEGGARYLSWLLERYDGRTELALAGYNAGEGAVDRYRDIPPYAETRAYVARVLEGAGSLAR